MSDITLNVITQSRKRITRGYTIALALMVMMLASITLATDYMIVRHDHDWETMAIAERQRTMTQRIGMLALDLSVSDASTKREALQEFHKSVKLMSDEHELLLHGGHIAGRKSQLSKEMIDVYFSGKPSLNDLLDDFIATAKSVMRLSPAEFTHQNPMVIKLVGYSRSTLMSKLDEAVVTHSNSSHDNIDFLQKLVAGISVLAIAVLFFVALLILRPALIFVSQAQQRLLELNQLKGDFLANISHEIRTPMNGIFGMTELLLESPLESRQQHYVRTLQNSADHLLGLINDVLDFSKLEAGQMKLDPIRFNLLATIEDVLDLLASRAREKNLELLVRYQPGTPRFIVADPGRVRQVLFNLIGNAIKFTDTGYVLVHVDMLNEHGKKQLRVRIEDTGIGIPEDKVDTLFDKFTQVESGSTRARQGTGLGLSISKNLVELMEGTIGVESTPGKGTVFSMKLPMQETDDAQQDPTQKHVQFKNMRALLVDDLAPNRMLFKEVLESAGMQCDTAENVEEAMSLLRYAKESGKPFHVIFSDYMMPKVDGLAFTQMLKANANFAAIPLIIMSSAGELGLVKKFAEAGAEACLYKPVSRQQLYDTLSHLLEAKAQGKQLGIITIEASAAISARRLLSGEKPLAGTHILLVEDNRVNSEITSEMLQNLGCKVMTAENGEIAIDSALANKFDLIFMDCQMPVMDGFEAARHIVALKAKGEINDVPIVALTANALKGDRERCLSSGMDDYLCKPVRKANLEAILLKWLGDRLEQLEASTQRKEDDDIDQHVVVKLPTSPSLHKAVPTNLSPDRYGIDAHAFEVTRDMLGDKLPTVLSYYLEDSGDYLLRISQALQLEDVTAAMNAAHSLKSSSRQFGIRDLADLASRCETAARTVMAGGLGEDMNALHTQMQQALDRVRPFIEANCDKAA